MSKTEKKKEERGQLESLVRISALGFQIAVMVGGGAWVGNWLDEKYSDGGKWFTLLLVLVSVTLAIFYAVRQLNQSNKDSR